MLKDYLPGLSLWQLSTLKSREVDGNISKLYQYKYWGGQNLTWIQQLFSVKIMEGFLQPDEEENKVQSKAECSYFYLFGLNYLI